MPNSKAQRKLVAILFADIVGYTSLMQRDEAAARKNVKKFRDTLNEKVAQYLGQIIQYYGDGCLCTFDSTVNAMECARVVQQIFQTDPIIPVRIGLHTGDVYFEEENIYGDSVNIASRVESLGVAGAVLFSKSIKKHISNQKDFEMQSLGEFEFKNVVEPMEVFALTNKGLILPKRGEMKGKLKESPKSKKRSFIPAILGLLLSLFGLVYFLTPKKAAASIDESALIIFPFDIQSANSNIQYLSNGMVDLMSTKLEGIPDINPIDPNRIFNILEKNAEEIPSLSEAMSISSSLGSGEFILGNILEINDALQISATKYDSKGERLVKKTVEGPNAQLTSLIDDLTRSLIADKFEKEGRNFSSVATMTSVNLQALKAYLEGEQVYRKTDFSKAIDHFQKAVNLDSTFAMAWLRLYYSRAWINGAENNKYYLQKANLYADKLPPKWQDFVEASKVYTTGHESNEALFAELIKKYKNNAEFIFLMAEHLFHYNSYHGREIEEAKPWLEKSKELDPKNQEILRHLADLAWREGNIEILQKVLNDASPESSLWIINQIRLLTQQDSISISQMEELASHPEFNFLWFWPYQIVPSDPLELLEIGSRFAPFFNEIQNKYFEYAIHILKGQEKEASIVLNEISSINPGPIENTGLGRTALLIVGRDYLPFEENYQILLDTFGAMDQPFAYFFAAKYAWALGLEEEFRVNQQKLAVVSEKDQDLLSLTHYLHWSLNAFETRQKGDNDKALVYIDSAFQNPLSRGIPGVVDKIFMLADIYEEQQEYERAILRLENLPLYYNNYVTVHGFITYRLTQLYEKNGELDKALAKCNLFLKNYRDCDEKYRPWWDEVAERRKRLIDQVN